MMRRTIIALFCALLTACTGGSKLVTGPYATGQGGFTVTLGRSWSDITSLMGNRARNVHLLSIDGPFLNRLYLAGALRPGEFIVKPARPETPTPTFRADMSDTEIVEFVTDSVAALGYQRPETANLRPATLAAAPGVRFELTTQSTEGLNYSGTALVSRAGDRLNVLLYLAPSEHYYDAYLPEVEQVFASAAAR